MHTLARAAFESKADMVDAHPTVLAAERVARAADATKKISAEVGHFAQRHLGKVALQAAINIKADEYGAKATYRFLVMAATWRVDPSRVAAEAVYGGSGAASRARGRGRGQWARSSSAGGILRDAPRPPLKSSRRNANERGRYLKFGGHGHVSFLSLPAVQ